MLIALLPSEIARLILNYLEEENYLKTYDSFLNECRYLEECKIYLKQGISLPKTIHGKKLGDYLVLDNDPVEKVVNKNKPTVNQSTQTSTENETEEKNHSLNENDKDSQFKISNDYDNSPTIEQHEPAFAEVPNQSDETLKSPDKTDKKNEGIDHLTKLINSNEFEINLATDTSPAPKFKLVKTPEKIFKSPEIKLYRSPEKKIRLEPKPDIITLSSDSDDEMPINFNSNKKRRLLIGKSIEKVPELSVSTLERQLNSIVSDATNHMKLQEEQEKIQQQQQQTLQTNSLDILNTINKGPPIGDFQVVNSLPPLSISQSQPINQITTQIGGHQVIGQIAPLNAINQISHLNPVNSINPFGQISGQIAQIGQLGQIGQIAQIGLPQTINISNLVAPQPQRVIFVSNPNNLNLSYQASNNNNDSRQQILQLPQGLTSLNGQNVIALNGLNKKGFKHFAIPATQAAPILASAIKNCEAIISSAKTTTPKPILLIKPPTTNGETVKKIDESKIDANKKEKKQSSTIKNILEKNYNESHANQTVSSTQNDVNNLNDNNFIIIDNSSNPSTNSVVDTVSTIINQSNVISQPETRNHDDNVSDEILDFLGLKVRSDKTPTKILKSSKEEAKVSDFDLDCIVKKGTNSPAKTDNFQRRKSSRLEAKANDEMESFLNEALVSSTTNTKANTKTLRSRTNSQRWML